MELTRRNALAVAVAPLLLEEHQPSVASNSDVNLRIPNVSRP
jgi:hypothetical protein